MWVSLLLSSLDSGLEAVSVPVVAAVVLAVFLVSAAAVLDLVFVLIALCLHALMLAGHFLPLLMVLSRLLLLH